MNNFGGLFGFGVRFGEGCIECEVYYFLRKREKSFNLFLVSCILGLFFILMSLFKVRLLMRNLMVID